MNANCPLEGLTLWGYSESVKHSPGDSGESGNGETQRNDGGVARTSGGDMWFNSMIREEPYRAKQQEEYI